MGSLFLFILAITLMKEGAKGLAPLVRDTFKIDTPANALGFGWLFAYLVMSGSPVAASAFTFFDAGVITQYQSFAMITGSRLGASFIVLFIGFIYVMRGRNRASSLSMGLLSLTVTGTTYIVGLMIGTVILTTGALDSVQMHSGAVLNGLTDLIFDPIVNLIKGRPTRLDAVLYRLGHYIGELQPIRPVPTGDVDQGEQRRPGLRLVYRPWVMFLLGAGVTMISMSVSVSLSILVPLSHRGFVRRENVIPYIMGANITTFIDTLLAAVLLDNPQAFTVVLVEMVSITIVSAFILVTGLSPVRAWHAPVERVDHRQQPQPGDFHGDHFYHPDYACVDLRSS